MVKKIFCLTAVILCASCGDLDSTPKQKAIHLAAFNEEGKLITYCADEACFSAQRTKTRLPENDLECDEDQHVLEGLVIGSGSDNLVAAHDLIKQRRGDPFKICTF